MAYRVIILTETTNCTYFSRGSLMKSLSMVNTFNSIITFSTVEKLFVCITTIIA